VPARGGRLTAAGKREYTVSVRLSDGEREQWEAARDATGRKETGAWVRAVVTEALTGHPGLPGEPPRVPEVNHGVFLALAAIGNNLNQIAYLSNVSGSVPPDLHSRLVAAIEAVGDAALVVRGLKPLADAANVDVQEDEEPEDPDA
jgi:hypothetical protein